MTSLWRRFLLLLANAADSELANMVEFLKAENGMLRAKLPKRVDVTPAEKNLLLKLGKALGSKVRDLISIVSPRTFARWLAAAGESGSKAESSTKGGRPKPLVDVRALVLRMANENGWGYGRIVGELKKLGIAVAKSTVKDILREHGFDLGPKRGRGTWADFVDRHAKTLWACDLFQKKIWTLGGYVDFFALFFIHVGSRRVFLGGLRSLRLSPGYPETDLQRVPFRVDSDLYLVGEGVTDEIVERLEDLPRLEQFHLDETRISAKGLQRFHVCTKLKEFVTENNAGFRDADVRKLLARLPGCEWDRG